MYSLDINFLKDRKLDKASKVAVEKRTLRLPLSSNTPLIAGVAVMVLLPGLAGLYLWMLNRQSAELKSEIAALEAEIGANQAKYQSIEAMQQQIAQVNAQTEALVSVFNQIKPWSAILEDIRDRIPVGVQLNSIQQTDAQLTLEGFATSYGDVNNFLLALQASQFLNPTATKIQSAQSTDNPLSVELPEGSNVTVELPQMVNYTISTELNNVPASQLLAELSRKGAVGLVTRIRNLEQKGAITK